MRTVSAYARLLRSQHWSTAAIEEQSRHRLEETLRAASEITFYRDRLGGKTGSSQLRD
jgi:hypothetical protein